MRTTITLDDDVAVSLKQFQKKRGLKFKQAVNEALRSGLSALQSNSQDEVQFRVDPLPAGRPLLPNVDNISEVLDLAERE